MAFGLLTYQDASRREDLISLLKDVSPLGGNYLVGNLGTSVARNTLHEWTTFNQARPTSVTFSVEGADASFDDLTAPVRSVNYTAILTESVKVSNTERAVSVAQNIDPYTFQKEKALMRMNAKMEFAVLNGAGPSAGASGFARGMAGIDGCISTNATGLASGTSLTVTRLEDLLQLSYDQVGMEYIADVVLVPMALKRRISSFTTNITNYVNETDTLYKNISVFDSSLGQVRIIPHRDVRNVAGSTTIYALRMDTFKIAFLEGRQPSFTELPANGDFTAGQYITEMTLESLAQRASVKATGYSREAL
jgi:hypothetical protein